MIAPQPTAPRTVLITGASSGLGRALAAEFKKQSFSVIAVSRSQVSDNADFWIQADLTEKSAFPLIAESLKNFNGGHLDLLINNAGIGAYETWDSLDEAELRKLFELNFFAPVKLLNTVLPFLKDSRGSVINISSIAGHLHVPCMGAYCASKAAFSMFSDTLRAELIPHGIHVMNVTPGRIDTGFSKRSFGSKHVPSRFGGSASPDAFAKAVFKAFTKRKSSLVYPFWYFVMPWIAKLFRPFYDSASVREWKLD